MRRPHGCARLGPAIRRTTACRSTMEDMPCELSILLPFIVPPLASTACFQCWTVSRSAPGYPPYNIERTGENDYRVTVAVAGFGESELSIEAKENTLTIKGSKQVKEEQNGEVLYQGIAARAFERVFQLADHVLVKNAQPRERIAARRSRARNSRGEKAAPDRDWRRQSHGPGRDQGRGLTLTANSKTAAPRNSRGAFVC